MQSKIFPAVRLAVAAVAVLSGAAVLNGLTTPHTQTAKNVNVPVVAPLSEVREDARVKPVLRPHLVSERRIA